MQDLNYKLLIERLENVDPLIQLILYIYRVQGGELRRLNYGKAASVLGVSWSTVSRYCSTLAAQNIISFGKTADGNALQLNRDILTD